jgi:hypothetical protein
MLSVLFLFRINPENDPNISISFMAKAISVLELTNIIFLDFSKTFDSLEWDFMFSTLRHYGFNYSFVTWVETLYDNIQTCNDVCFIINLYFYPVNIFIFSKP